MRFTRQILILAFTSLVSVPAALAQFTSGSTGADGAYNPTVSGDFDPVALGLNAAGDNVFNFTTINIPAGVTIKLRASKLRNQPVVWLATGDVTITGVLDLTGANPASLNSDSPVQVATNRVLPEPGPGGYTGGLGSRGGVGPQPGAGPGGGPAGLQSSSQLACYGGSGSFFLSGEQNSAQSLTTGPTYGNYQLIPLYGGSGGGGGWDSASGQNLGGTGGAGGGAIRIASTTQITVNGRIDVSGGTPQANSGSTVGCPGGAGAGGAIHLIAPTVGGTGLLYAFSGNQIGGTAATGIVRISTNTNAYAGSNSGVTPGPLFLPPNNSVLSPPSLSITQVNGIAVPAQAAGSYLNPDVTIAAAGAVTVNLAAKNIPLGTVPTLRITAETGPDTTITCNALAGTVASSTATCSATFPFSVSIAGIRASW